jgi:hypothetical protein
MLRFEATEPKPDIDSIALYQGTALQAAEKGGFDAF